MDTPTTGYIEPSESMEICTTEQKPTTARFDTDLLSVTTDCQFSSITASKPQSFWACTTIKVAQAYTNTFPIDFVLVIDTSGSMAEQHKLAFVLSTVEYLIRRLDSHHFVTIIEFNTTAQLVVNRLPMNANNKEQLVILLRTLKCEGNTNISEALMMAFDVLNGRPTPIDSSELPLAWILLLTDGNANRGLRTATTLVKIRQMKLNNVTIHGFGYGSDHNASFLKELAFCTGSGIYSLINSFEDVASVFGTVLAWILSTSVFDVRMRLEARDGCRMMEFGTRNPLQIISDMKVSEIYLGCLYAQEERSTVIRLSLRSMSVPLAWHHLLDIIVSYRQFGDKETRVKRIQLGIERPKQAMPNPQTNPIVDLQVNRFLGAQALERAAQLVSVSESSTAQEKLIETIQQIKSSSANNEQPTKELLRYLDELRNEVSQPSVSSECVSRAHALSSMYYQQRAIVDLSVGDNQMESGYFTTLDTHREEAKRAVDESKRYVSSYCQFICD